MFDMVQFHLIYFQGKKYLVENWDSEWPNNPAYGPKLIIPMENL